MSRIAIVGSRGIPNAYGGFEWLAEKLALYLSASGHHIIVCQSTQHPFKESFLRDITLLRAWDPSIGATGQFVYDLVSIIKVGRLKPDVIILLGYTSSAVWSFLLPKESSIVQHMDGMEWKRDKYSGPIRAFLRRSEKIAARRANILIADHPVIFNYLKEKYSDKEIVYIAYGEDDTEVEQPVADLQGKTFDLVMARLEPENQIEMIISGWMEADLPHILAIAGSLQTRYGKMLHRKYSRYRDRIIFLGGVYDKGQALWLRRNCRYYLHGHKAGGTNPSLIQVLTHHRRILVHANPFNEYIAFTYGLNTFENSHALARLLSTPPLTIMPPNLLPEHRWTEIFRRFEEIL